MKVAISIGDLNGIGLEIALKSHDKINILFSIYQDSIKEIL